MENHWGRIGHGDLGIPVCSLIGAVLHVLRATSVTAMELLTRCPATCNSLLALTGQPPISRWKWQERMAGAGITQQGEQSTQELLCPPSTASSGAFQTAFWFYGLLEGLAELTTVGLMVTVYYRKYGNGGFIYVRGEHIEWRTGNQPDSGLLCLCSSWSQNEWQHETLPTRMLPQPPCPEILLRSFRHD